LGSRNTFLHTQLLTYKNFRDGTPLSEVNNAVDGGALLLTYTTVDANAKAHAPSVRFILSLLQTWLYNNMFTKIDCVEFELHCAHLITDSCRSV